MARSEEVVIPLLAADRGLQRHLGSFGLLWVSVSSMIGSGWLFSALFAAQVAGPAAVVGWVISTVAVLVLALVLAELDEMFSVLGGTARYPHYASGSVTGFAMGWFSWLAGVTVAPIEVEAALQYANNYVPGLAHSAGGTVVLKPIGYPVAAALLAIFTVINLIGIRKLAHANSAASWWKTAMLVLVILVFPITRFHAANFTAGGGFAPYGIRGIIGSLSTGAPESPPAPRKTCA